MILLWNIRFILTRHSGHQKGQNIEHEILKIDQIYDKLLSNELVEKEVVTDIQEVIIIEKDSEDWTAIVDGIE